MVPESKPEAGDAADKPAVAVPVQPEAAKTLDAGAPSQPAEPESPQPAQKEEKPAKGLLKKDREFVIPGDIMVETMDYLPGRNCFRKGDSIYAKKIGLVSVNGRVVSVISLNEVYIAKAGDMVIGEVKEVQSNGWVINVNTTTEGYMPLSGVREFIDTTRTELSSYYTVGDLIYAKISSANYNSVHISMDDSRARKFRSGRIVKINPAKVPRLIGKQGSMISLIKDKTGCRISVGQNGLVWLEGENEALAIEAISLVEDKSHIDGLTDKISKVLDKAPKRDAAKPAENPAAEANA